VPAVRGGDGAWDADLGGLMTLRGSAIGVSANQEKEFAISAGSAS